MDEIQIVRGLGVSLGLGLIVGIERGWQARSAEEGARVAGLRTFGLIGLGGGICGLLSREFGGGGFALAGLILAVGVNSIAQWRLPSRFTHAGVTTIFAVLVTYSVGVLAALGHEAAAASGAVATAVLLGLKPKLHGWLRTLEEKELFAVLQILVISVVVLPLLPNRGFGPYAALNPFEIWWMVVLVSGLSFLGYFLVKILGPGRGLGVAALCGGLVSSTAITLSFARLCARRPELGPLLSVGIVLASSIMFVRIMVIVAVVQVSLLAYVAPTMTAMAAAGLGVAAWRWRRTAPADTPAQPVSNPLDVGPALVFGLVLGLVLLLSHWLTDLFGASGVYALSLASGIADVDAITLSLSRIAVSETAPSVAALGIVIAALANTVTKAILSGAIGGRAMARLILMPTVLIVLASVAGVIATALLIGQR